jgi:hypothetical protein
MPGYAGIDWATAEHAVSVIDASGRFHSTSVAPHR